jgi:predicted TIM-barrel fold metal-dependent hydrolase
VSGSVVIDAHVHTYPTAQIGLQASGGMAFSGCTGTVQELLGLMAVGGIDKAVMVNMTPVTDMREAALARGEGPYEEVAHRMIERMKRRNAWTCQVAREHPSLVPYISLDPSMGPDDAVAEIRQRTQEGARGIKLHPSAQRFNPDDPSLWPAYAEAEALGLPVISHGGIFPLDPESSEHSRPRAFARVLEAFPRLTLVVAHLGDGYLEESLAMAAGYPNLFFDCSSAVNGTVESPPLSDEEAVDIINRIGVDRVLFGSDWPWFHPLRDRERIEALPFSNSERDLILGGNAQRVLGL